MLRRFLKTKIRGSHLKGTPLEHKGSIALVEDWLEAAGIALNEDIQVLNVEAGVRFTTCVILGSVDPAWWDSPGRRFTWEAPVTEPWSCGYALLHAEEVPGPGPVIQSVNPQ